MMPDRRLHPLSFLFVIGAELRRMIAPVILLVYASTVDLLEATALFLIVHYAAYVILRQFTTRYGYTDDDLVIAQGVFFRTERRIPYDRVHNIALSRNVFHRLLDVAAVQVETGSGLEPEASLRVLTLDAVDEMRARVASRKSAKAIERDADRGPGVSAGGPRGESIADATPPDRVLVALSLRDIVLYGLIHNRGFLVVTAALGALWELDWANRSERLLTRERIAMLLQQVERGTGPLDAMVPTLVTVLLLTGLLVAALIVVRLLSVGWALSTLHGFRLVERGDDLVITRGLFTQVSTVVPRHRLQTVTVRETPLHRWLGRVEVRVETVVSTIGEHASRAPRWAAPILRRDALPALMAELMPGHDYDAVEWQPVSRRTAARLTRRWFLWTTIVLIAGGIAVGWNALWGAAALPVAWLISRRQAEAHRWALTPDVVGAHTGWLWRRTAVLPVDRAQTLTLRQSPFDRRWEMAAVVVDTAAPSRAGGSLVLPWLAAADASALYRLLRARVAATAFRWN
jgi:putative membrane protein